MQSWLLKHQKTSRQERIPGIRVQASQTVVEVFISEDDLDVSEENIQEIPKKELAASSDKDNKQPILPKAGDTVTNYTLLGLVLVLIWLIMQRKRKKKE
ncbi:LPXTG cell wall anchor domain-containing protein [Listeria monocytogenes]|uniref:LPXTG cell wall anchor domain-containing protein n=1 Tax=Listeria monocytogenes TaxID=1639 RepID=UPI0021507CB1|nr:LPXTG cell wall anchor domain-containing protein [Listeria monocytogenes]MCR6398475.1 LPXTG cell wall anchor domain-containing protein [Listeria monocytogenes]MCR6413199.1 LPXTG cell wall anchor domain-containing protein [Listeria monocytogenes]MCR6420201.1 LPXTG cell wall anchor domain-containing protein [Listeria monocytogenes]MCR6440840.1 LPXTG cell wall anchor domain-containing protein [Listeria monocytogenes]MCR6441976.1 LPXTG cell wall anchor domain-containing protein [Listeria monocy